MLRKTHNIDMTEGPVLGKMLKFALPLMASNMLQLLFNAADVIVVGKFAGDNSLAAVGSTSSLINLFINLFIGISVGVNVIAARYVGSRNDAKLDRTVHTSMLLAIISGVVMAILGVFLSEPMLRLMKSPDEVLPLSALYLKIYFLGMPANMTYMFGSALLRAKGDTERPLTYLSIAGIINVALNLLLVIQFHLDVAGVAIATVISQFVSAILIWRCLAREEGPGKLIASKLRIHKDSLIPILKIGIPSGVQGVLFSISNVIIQSSVNSFGSTAVAGNSAAQNLDSFIYMAMNSMYQATISFTGQNIGAGKKDRIMKIVKGSLAATFGIGFIFGMFVFIFGRPLLSIYTDSESVIDYGMIRLGIIATTYFLCGFMDDMSGIMRGLGHSVAPMVISLIGSCVLRIVWIMTVFQIARFHTLEVIYYSYPLSWAVTFAAHCVMFGRIKKKMGI